MFGTTNGLALQTKDGDLIWSTGATTAGNLLKFKSSGDFQVTWSSGYVTWTAGSGGANLLLLEGCKLSVKNSSTGTTYFTRGDTACNKTSRALDGSSLTASGYDRILQTEEAYLSWNGWGALQLMTTGGTELWSSGTLGYGKKVNFQTDGNLTVHNAAGQSIYWANTVVTDAEYLVLGDDCTLTLEDAAGNVEKTISSGCDVANYSYDQTDGNDDFGIGMRNEMEATTVSGNSQLVSVTALEATLFGVDVTLFSVSALQTELSDSADQNGLTFSIYGEATVTVNKEFEKTFFQQSKTFMAGPIPVTLSAGVTGKLALALSYSNNDSLSLTPSAGLYATVSAGVGYSSKYLSAQAGVQISERAGDRWTVAEEDLLGRYDAAYQRAGDEVTRQRTGYSALRGPAGLNAGGAAGVRPAEDARFAFDERGLVAASLSYELAIASGDGLPPVTVTVHAELERERVEMVPARFGPAFALGPIREDIDYDAVQRSADRSMVAGASLAELLAATAGTSAGQARANTLARLAAFVRLEPAAATTIADELRASADDASRVSLLAGALASTESAAGTDALAGLVAAPLPDDARGTVINALQFSRPTTEASLRALTTALDGDHAAAAAVALGSHARHAHRDLSTDDAVEQLLSRYAAATTDAERVVYLQSLGNTGSTRALPVFRQVLSTNHPQLAIAAAFGLRFIPDPEADALLHAALSNENLALAALRAIAYRDAGRWEPSVREAESRYADNTAIQGEIRAILRRWS